MSLVLTGLFLLWFAGLAIMASGMVTLCFTAAGKRLVQEDGRTLREDRTWLWFACLPVWPLLIAPPFSWAILDYVAPEGPP